MLVVLDTNVLVSGVFWGGKPERILIGWRENRFEVVASPSIIWEYEAIPAFRAQLFRDFVLA